MPPRPRSTPWASTPSAGSRANPASPTTPPTPSPTTTAPSGRRGWIATWPARPDRGSADRAARRRQADHEAGAALGAVRDLDAAAVAFDDPLSDGQAEARAAARSAGCSIETFEDMRHVLGPDPRAVVLDDERGAAGAGPHGDPDAPIDRAVADRVVDQDHDELSKPRRVAGDDRRLRVDEDVDAAIGRRLAHRRRAVGGDVAEVDRHVLKCDRA